MECVGASVVLGKKALPIACSVPTGRTRRRVDAWKGVRRIADLRESPGKGMDAYGCVWIRGRFQTQPECPPAALDRLSAQQLSWDRLLSAKGSRGRGILRGFLSVPSIHMDSRPLLANNEGEDGGTV